MAARRTVSPPAHSQEMSLPASLISARLTDRAGGPPFLYAWHGDPVRVLTPREVRTFLDEYRRRRI